jgi:hypothetical protein
MADDDLDMFIDLAAAHGRNNRKRDANISQGHHPEAQPKGVTSKLARLLVESWSLGVLGAKTVQQLASAACADGSSHPDLVNWLVWGHMATHLAIATGAWSMH